jgi:hypothetical protein
MAEVEFSFLRSFAMLIQEFAQQNYIANIAEYNRLFVKIDLYKKGVKITDSDDIKKLHDYWCVLHQFNEVDGFTFKRKNP